MLTVKNKSHSVTAKVTIPAGGAEGVIITQGGRVGGWSLYAKQGKLKYCYNFFGIQDFFVESTGAIPPGEHELRMQFKYDGGGVGKGGDVTLEVDGKPVGKGRVERTIPMAYSADEACDVGSDSGSPTAPDYGDEGLERQDRLGPDRPRRRQPGPSGPARGPHPPGDGPRIASLATRRGGW